MYAWVYSDLSRSIFFIRCCLGSYRSSSTFISTITRWDVDALKVVALFMFAYGFAKIFGLQFTFPSSTILMTEVGSLKSSELMKVFMGTSQTYSAIAGWAEVIGGIMLCFRRTTLIGSFITFGLMTNILAMNIFYDFGMQRLALELTVFSMIIMTPY